MAEQNSVSILHADGVYEDLRVVLDDRAELKYAVNKAPVRKSISVCGMQTGK